MRRIIHFFLFMLGFVSWGIGNVLYSVCAGISILADRVDPNSEWGNCWGYVLPRWWLDDGYLIIRRAYGNMFLGFLPLPHVLWAKNLNLGVADVEHFSPLERKKTKWFPWYAVYFRGRVINRDVVRRDDSNA